MPWHIGLVVSGCTSVTYGSLVYETGPGSSFPNLGTAGDYPLSVSSTVGGAGGNSDITHYIARNGSIPKTAVGLADAPAHTVIIREFGDFQRLCGIAEDFLARHTGTFAYDYVADDATLTFPDGHYTDGAWSYTANPVGPRPLDGGYTGGGANPQTNPPFGDSINAGMGIRGTFPDLGYVPFYNEYDSARPGLDPTYSGYHEAPDCESALFGPCVMVEIINSGTNEDGEFFDYTQHLYIGGVLARSYCCVTQVPWLGDPGDGYANFGITLHNVEDPDWSDSVIRFGMFRRSCEPYTLPEALCLMVEAAGISTTDTLIYRIDDEPGDGDTIPNLGTYPNADLTVGLALTTLTAVKYDIPFCDPSLPWTALVRAGDFSSGSSSSSTEGNLTAGNGQPTLWEYGETINGLGSHIPGGLYGLAQVASENDSNTVFMVSCNPPTIGSMTADYRVVRIDSGVVTTISATPVLYSPGTTSLGVSFTQTNRSWADGVNGLALWREYITTDAQFLTKYNEFLSA